MMKSSHDSFRLRFGLIAIRFGFDLNEVLLENIVFDKPDGFKESPYFLRIERIIVRLTLLSLWRSLFVDSNEAIHLLEVNVKGVDVFIEKKDDNGTILMIYSRALGYVPASTAVASLEETCSGRYHEWVLIIMRFFESLYHRLIVIDRLTITDLKVTMINCSDKHEESVFLSFASILPKDEGCGARNFVDTIIYLQDVVQRHVALVPANAAVFLHLLAHNYFIEATNSMCSYFGGAGGAKAGGSGGERGNPSLTSASESASVSVSTSNTQPATLEKDLANVNQKFVEHWYTTISAIQRSAVSHTSQSVGSDLEPTIIPDESVTSRNLSYLRVRVISAKNCTYSTKNCTAPTVATTVMVNIKLVGGVASSQTLSSPCALVKKTTENSLDPCPLNCVYEATFSECVFDIHTLQSLTTQHLEIALFDKMVFISDVCIGCGTIDLESSCGVREEKIVQVNVLTPSSEVDANIVDASKNNVTDNNDVPCVILGLELR